MYYNFEPGSLANKGLLSTRTTVFSWLPFSVSLLIDKLMTALQTGTLFRRLDRHTWAIVFPELVPVQVPSWISSCRNQHFTNFLQLNGIEQSMTESDSPRISQWVPSWVFSRYVFPWHAVLCQVPENSPFVQTPLRTCWPLRLVNMASAPTLNVNKYKALPKQR